MPRPICVPCRIEYQCKKNGFLVRDPECSGSPSTYWSGDLYACGGCGSEIVVGIRGSMDSNLGEVLADSEGVLEFHYSKKVAE